MTPKEKAEDLLNKMNVVHYIGLSRGRKLPVSMYDDQIKQCALIAVEELIRVTPWGGDFDHEIEDGSKEFYMKVKQEIEKI